MKAKVLLTILIFFFTGFACNAIAAEKGKNKQEIITSGTDDQKGVALTIYNVNLGLVKDQREIRFALGTGELRFMDVASQIIPTSVHIKSLLNHNSLQILEQNYEYDLLNPQKLLDKYVGKEVKLYYKNPYTYEAGFEISLRNHKKEDAVVKVVEPIPGDWKMLSSSHEYNKTEAFTAEFNIPVPKDKEVKLTYRVRMRY